MGVNWSPLSNHLLSPAGSSGGGVLLPGYFAGVASMGGVPPSGLARKRHSTCLSQDFFDYSTALMDPKAAIADLRSILRNAETAEDRSAQLNATQAAPCCCHSGQPEFPNNFLKQC